MPKSRAARIPAPRRIVPNLPDLPPEILHAIIGFLYLRTRTTDRFEPEESAGDLASLALAHEALWDAVISSPTFDDLGGDARREGLLIAKLREYGLPLREDSRLCREFIGGYEEDERGKTADEIVNVMREMDWYFRCTSYEKDRVIWDEEEDKERPIYWVDSEEGKRIARRSWVAGILDDGLFVLPRVHQPHRNRPPESLWDTLETEITRQVWAKVARFEAKAKNKDPTTGVGGIETASLTPGRRKNDSLHDGIMASSQRLANPPRLSASAVLRLLLLLPLLHRCHASLPPPYLDPSLSSTNTLPFDVGAPVLRDIFVSPAGDPLADGRTAAAPTTFHRAWGELIPRTGSDAGLTTGHRIVLLPGTYAEATVPYWFENAHGTHAFPVVLQAADGPGTVVIEQFLNIYNCRFLYLVDLTVSTRSEALHFEKCHYVLLRGVDADAHGQGQETLKANQCTHLYVENCTFAGSGQAALDYVAVQHGHVLGSEFRSAGDWCLYVKGGSAHLRIEGNEMHGCFTGGFTAGQGTGFEFMEPPYIYYEAVDVKFTNNHVHDVFGACFGCNGCAYSLFAFNECRGTGNRSHLLEFVPGMRNCNPANAARCASRNAAGGWGPADRIDGPHMGNAPVPCRNVYVINNRIVNEPPDESMWTHLAVFPPMDAPGGTNIPSPVRSDDGLVVRGNAVRNGPPGKRLGVGEDPATAGCWDDNPSCNAAQLVRDNAFNAGEAVLVEPVPDFPAWEGGVMASMPRGATANGMVTRAAGRWTGGTSAATKVGATLDAGGGFRPVYLLLFADHPDHGSCAPHDARPCQHGEEVEQPEEIDQPEEDVEPEADDRQAADDEPAAHYAEKADDHPE
ncbi:pectin lyase fold/virulence factor [Hyaloraphidium curvatum]|nr:pectin lyase fold/virulence factor [Hyaloraphidium curvatum]